MNYDDRINEIIKKLEQYSEEDRKLSEEVFSKYMTLFDAAQASNQKPADGIIEGINRALQLKILATERLTKIINQIIRLRQQDKFNEKVNDGNDYKTKLNKIVGSITSN